MFLGCLSFPRKDGSQRKYLQIIETYREKGRVRQKIIANLGRLDELIASGTLEKLTEAMNRYVECLVTQTRFLGWREKRGQGNRSRVGCNTGSLRPGSAPPSRSQWILFRRPAENAATGSESIDLRNPNDMFRG
jgi:hypothetical protein